MWIYYLPSDFREALYELISPRISQYNNQGQTTTPGTPCPTVYDNHVGSFTSPANHFNAEDAGEDLKVQPFAYVITKAALSSNSQLF